MCIDCEVDAIFCTRHAFLEVRDVNVPARTRNDLAERREVAPIYELSHAHFAMNVGAARGAASPVSKSFLPVVHISGTGVRREQPSSNSNLPSGQPRICSPARMAMHVSGVCEVVTNASLSDAWRNLGGPHSHGVDHELNSGVVKTSRKLSVAKRAWFLHGARFFHLCGAVGCLLSLQRSVVEVRKQRKLSFRSSLSRWALSSSIWLEVSGKAFDLLVL